MLVSGFVDFGEFMVVMVLSTSSNVRGTFFPACLQENSSTNCSTHPSALQCQHQLTKYHSNIINDVHRYIHHCK